MSETTANGAASADPWDGITHLLFDVRPVDGQPPEGQLLSAFRLGSMIAGQVRGSPQGFRRDASVIARGGSGWVLVQYYLVGGYSGAAGNEPVVVQQGDISCLDLAYGFETVAAQPFENINVLIPRQLWLARSDSARIPHGSVIRANGACARIIQATLSQFMAEASGLDAAEAVALSVALVDMLAGSFKPTALADCGGTLDRTRMLRDYLDRHLGDPQLCASRVASALGLSRANLYRAAEPLGGVARYIRDERLRQAFNALRSMARGHRHARVSTVARECGFANEATFSRLFKAQYGVAPSQARSQALLSARQPPNDHVVNRWLLEEQGTLLRS